MSHTVANDRRRFLGSVAMTLAAARLGPLGSMLAACAASPQPAAGELASLGRATAWLNSACADAGGARRQGRPEDIGPTPTSTGSARSPTSARGPSGTRTTVWW